MGSRKLSGPGGTLDLSGGAPHNCATRGFFMYVRRMLYALTNCNTAYYRISRPRVHSGRGDRTIALRTSSVRYRLCVV